MIKAFHPDDSGLIERTRRTNNGGHGGNGNGQISPFMPGQQGALARQLGAGFGGTPGQWDKRFGQMYSPMQVPQPFHYSTVGGDAQQSNNNPDHPIGKPMDTPDGWPVNPTHSRMQQMSPEMMQQAQPAQQAQMQAQPQAQPQGQEMSPEMLAMIRQYMMQRGV